MKSPFSRLFVFLVAAILFIPQVHAQVVEIPDPNLESAIREELQLPTDTPVTKQDMEKLTELSAWNSNISDLTGIEHAIYLDRLALRGNQIRDLTPIEGLIHLKLLTLTRNPLTDIKSLGSVDISS